MHIPKTGVRYGVRPLAHLLTVPLITAEQPLELLDYFTIYIIIY
jgi:hypothetical protein